MPIMEMKVAEELVKQDVMMMTTDELDYAKQDWRGRVVVVLVVVMVVALVVNVQETIHALNTKSDLPLP